GLQASEDSDEAASQSRQGGHRRAELPSQGAAQRDADAQGAHAEGRQAAQGYARSDGGLSHPTRPPLPCAVSLPLPARFVRCRSSVTGFPVSERGQSQETSSVAAVVPSRPASGSSPSSSWPSRPTTGPQSAAPMTSSMSSPRSGTSSVRAEVSAEATSSACSSCSGAW